MGGSFSCCVESSNNAEFREYEVEEANRRIIPQLPELRESDPDHPVSLTEITNPELASEIRQFFFFSFSLLIGNHNQ